MDLPVISLHVPKAFQMSERAGNHAWYACNCLKKDCASEKLVLVDRTEGISAVAHVSFEQSVNIESKIVT